MTKLEAILKDVESLEGKEVTIFGQPVTLDNYQDKGFTPRVKDFITALMDYEVNTLTSDKIINLHNHDDNFKCLRVDNSYNWSGSIDHNFSYYHYQYKDSDFIIFSVHRYGDVRVNYTEEAVLKMTLNEFYEVMAESLNVYDSIDIDGITYHLTIRPDYEAIEVESQGGESFEIYSCADQDDIIQAIKDHLAEAVAESEVK